jgi:hypothetical protein
MSKTKFKNRMRMFWTQMWKYERTPEQWAAALSGFVKVNNISFMPHPIFDSHLKAPYGKKAIDLLEDALDKLVLEKKLKKEEAKNMKKMISGTQEDAFIAISIMANLKPKKFKKNVEELSGV